MAADEKNQDAKDKIAEGMAGGGKQPEPGTGSGKPGGTGGPQKSGGSDEVGKGMGEAGKQLTGPEEGQAERVGAGGFGRPHRRPEPPELVGGQVSGEGAGLELGHAGRRVVP